MNTANYIYLGIKGRVVALERNSGQKMWETQLKVKGLTDGFVNVVFDDDALFAHSGGELFCLDPVSGKLRWHNDLPGLGYGMATFASPTLACSNQIPVVLQEKRRREQQASSSTNTSAST